MLLFDKFVFVALYRGSYFLVEPLGIRLECVLQLHFVCQIQLVQILFFFHSLLVGVALTQFANHCIFDSLVNILLHVHLVFPVFYGNALRICSFEVVEVVIVVVL